MTDDELRAALAGLEERLGARGDAVRAEIMDRLDRLQGTITEIRELRGEP